MLQTNVGDLMVSIVFLLALNFTYAACLLPDHDTIGTYEHHHDSYQGSDWGATQVWNSASWSVGSAFTTELFGGKMEGKADLFVVAYAAASKSTRDVDALDLQVGHTLRPTP